MMRLVTDSPDCWHLDSMTCFRVGFDRAWCSLRQRCVLWLLCLAVALVGSTGCVSMDNGTSPPPRSRSGSGSGKIEEIHLFTAPTALNLDGIPGPDGFELRIYASSVGRAHGLTITRGTIEVLFYDGVLRESDDGSSKPLHVWSFTPSQLRPFGSPTSLGVGYRLTMRWGADKPTKDSFTVITRYLLPNQTPMVSAPNVVAMAVK